MTPAKVPLLLPSLALAEAIAEEWRGQGDRLKPADLPLTQLANTAIDRVASDPKPVIDELVSYAGSDLVCYWAEGPESLVERQRQHWRPLLDDLALRHDALLTVHYGVMPRPQPPEALAALARHLATLSPFMLTGLTAATSSCGSLVIGLALTEGRLTPDEAFELSQLDETYQIEQWGEDAAAAVRRRALRREILDTHRFLTLAQ